MISVATLDWTDRDKTMEIAKKIREAGVLHRLRYKPDVFTTLEIYRRNDFGIRPTIYCL